MYFSIKRAINTSIALLLTISSLTSIACGRELLGSRISENLQAFSHISESTYKVAELEAKVDILMKTVTDQQETINNFMQHAEHANRLQSSPSLIDGIIDRDFIEKVATAVSHTVF